jgi:hypothetical protein
MERRFFEGFEKGIGHIGSHAIGSRQDAHPTFSFIRTEGELSLHFPYLIHLECLPFRFDKHDIGMETVINLFTGKAAITGIPLPALSLKAVEGLGELESDPSLSDPLIACKEITVDNLLLFDRPPQQLNRSLVSDDVFEGHNLFFQKEFVVISSEFGVKTKST